MAAVRSAPQGAYFDSGSCCQSRALTMGMRTQTTLASPYPHREAGLTEPAARYPAAAATPLHTRPIPMAWATPAPAPMVQAPATPARGPMPTPAHSRANVGKAPTSRLPVGHREPSDADAKQGVVALGPGARVSIAGHRFVLSEALGQGSFGMVWAATDRAGTQVAIKEISGRSARDHERSRDEVRLLEVVSEVLGNASDGATVRVPTLVCSETTPVPGTDAWLLRVAMTRLPGTPLEEFLEQKRNVRSKQGQVSAETTYQQFSDSCRYAGEMLVQLAPTLEALSARLYHRDVTPRNILVDTSKGRDQPSFYLVDFGLAVDGETWRCGGPGAGDLGGDGRYWPASAWLVFAMGASELDNRPSLREEYRTCLDIHALGLSVLRCLMDMLPHLPEPAAGGAIFRRSAAYPQLRTLRAAWSKYWSDARRFWQPIYDAFRTRGDFDALRAAFIGAGVHHTVSANLCTLRAALSEARLACMDAPRDTGLAGMPALFEALLMMIHPGSDSREQPGRPEQLPRNSVARSPSATRPKMSPSPWSQTERTNSGQWSSHSTGTPDSSPSRAASSSSSGSLASAPSQGSMVLLGAQMKGHY